MNNLTCDYRIDSRSRSAPRLLSRRRWVDKSVVNAETRLSVKVILLSGIMCIPISRFRRGLCIPRFRLDRSASEPNAGTISVSLVKSGGDISREISKGVELRIFLNDSTNNRCPISVVLHFQVFEFCLLFR